MKKQLLGLMTILSVIGACQKNEVASLSEDVTIHATIEEKDATRTVMDENNNILWSENDQIVAFMKSSYGHKYQVKPAFVGKSYADFSMVSSGNGSDLSAGNEWEHNVVYYPYSEDIECLKSGSNYELEVNLPSEQVYVPDSFANGSMAMVAVSENNNITFKNVLGGIKLRLKGTQTVKSIKVEGNNDEKLSGPAIVTAYVNGMTPAITMTGTDDSAKSVTLDCGEGIQLNKSVVTDFIISLPPVIFSEGFTITIIDSYSQLYTIETSKSNVVLRSSILTMPIVGVDEDIDNSGDETYVQLIYINKHSLTMPPNTSYTFITDIDPVDVTYSTLAWISSDETVVKVDQTGTVTAVAGGKATITAMAVGGASVVSEVTVEPLAKATTDYIDEYGVNHGKGIAIGHIVWAPVNCGYKVGSYPYGKLYQWGRKFGQGIGQGYDDASYTKEYDGAMPSYASNENFSDIFYVGLSSNNGDWCKVRTDNLWNAGTEEQPIKTDNDPCPEGWRVPTHSELSYFKSNFQYIYSSEYNQYGHWMQGYYDIDIENCPRIFLPSAGRLSYSDGSSRGYDQTGYYWSSSINYTDAIALVGYESRIYTWESGVGSNERAEAYTVRCVQE